MAKRLTIEGDEAVAIAERLARHQGSTPSEVVTRLLREAEVRKLAEAPLNPGQQYDYDTLRALVKAAAHHKRPDATSDHSDPYDTNGLPT
ncbi:hypothetical protein FF100_19050 [Methylobacterium terricola]|uniref:Rv0623-like transcription factor n=1 Tax=Methylobacterium terricola TaxID=2583531 RepID=A0A5C4LDW4_9HYPH|nr:type II toxin-antitoxin system VapB family antitoxin [Methylobacterium terricola]TNC11735.1 hypothetical protein FF100_19050 [Methylobacterium terricola]